MRYSKLTYCLLAFLCLATTSCIQNELIEEYPIEQENPVQVHLTLNMPQATSCLLYTSPSPRDTR